MADELSIEGDDQILGVSHNAPISFDDGHQHDPWQMVVPHFSQGGLRITRKPLL